MKTFLFIVHRPHILKEPPTPGNYAFPSCSPSHQCLCIDVSQRLFCPSPSENSLLPLPALSFLGIFSQPWPTQIRPELILHCWNWWKHFQFRDELCPFQNCMRQEEVRAMLIWLKMAARVLVSVVVEEVVRGQLFHGVFLNLVHTWRVRVLVAKDWLQNVVHGCQWWKILRDHTEHEMNAQQKTLAWSC